ncbi:MAG: flagellar export chaperone FliS [Thermodesulfobacteriota bacterium]
MQTLSVHKQYISTQVSTADRLQLVVMLYDGAITFLKQAKEKMAAQDAAGKGFYFGKALDIIAELNASLNFQEGKEVSANLFHLYNFMTAHLTRANLNWDAAAVDDVIKMLSQLRDAWEEVCQKSRKGEIQDVSEKQSMTPRANLGSLVV